MYNNNILNYIKSYNTKNNTVYKKTKNNLNKKIINKIQQINLLSQTVSKIIPSKAKIKIDVRLVKDYKDNIEILGKLMHKKIMESPRRTKRLLTEYVTMRVKPARNKRKKK